MIIRIFVMSVPTKPLNDAQMRGAFLYIYVLLSTYANGKVCARRFCYRVYMSFPCSHSTTLPC